MRSRTPAPEQQPQKSEGVERHALNKRPSRRRHQRQSSKRKIHPVDTTITITTTTTSKLPATSARHVKTSSVPPPPVPESTLSSPPFAGHHHHHKSRRRFHHGRLRALSQHMRGHKCVTCNQPRRSCQCHVVSSEEDWKAWAVAAATAECSAPSSSERSSHDSYHAHPASLYHRRPCMEPIHLPTLPLCCCPPPSSTGKQPKQPQQEEEESGNGTMKHTRRSSLSILVTPPPSLGNQDAPPRPDTLEHVVMQLQLEEPCNGNKKSLLLNKQAPAEWDHVSDFYDRPDNVPLTSTVLSEKDEDEEQESSSHEFSTH